MSKEKKFIDISKLESFVLEVFKGLGVPEEDAKICTDLITVADECGIDSHGVGRLMMYYNRLKRGQQQSTTKIDIEKEFNAIARLNANNGMGQVVSKIAMDMTIEKAKKFGIGMVTVGNSNHFGIAGYYSLMAADNDCIGICGTNARPSVSPTWSVDPLLGTNPLTIGLPTDWGFHWVADHATSIVQRGKIEMYQREGKKCVSGWIIDRNGNSETDANKILQDLLDFKASLTPLGGKGEELGGHKGYNYATLVEILSSCLSSANFLRGCFGFDENNNEIPYNLGHFFIAIDINAFMPTEEFKKKTGDLLRQMANSTVMPGAEHIYIAGEKEHLKKQERKKTGIPLSEETQRQILTMQKELGLNQFEFDFEVEQKKSNIPGW